MKNVIYTILVGNYDSLMQPLAVDERFDYVCFSNDITDEKVGVWTIRRIPFENSDNTRVSRYPKILPHKVFPDCDYSLYIDANIQIIGRELYDVINRKIEENALIAQVPNIFRNCIYKDIEIAYRKRKVDLKGAKRQYKHLEQEEFPAHFGLFENNVILRKHNDPMVIEISEAWWKEYSNYTHRDQFCLMYVYWRHNYMPTYLFGEGKNARNVEYLKLVKHPRKKTFFLRSEKMLDNNEKIHSLLRKFVWRLFSK